ncbi:tetratricopeptide repeat protein [Synechococcus sp. BA-124 BA4]|uniref:tetratricopeptide repeat protein n=1 Tax=unclassified Synechococcus TaxID=2626047 RepID=UPI002AD55FE7|nr:MULTISPECIES: tetratricopeptide repeat protein [unclassified Synechococcus]MEA5401052.1 tetratricopeptide repeat protein [Synechococcus sp. BA-124 BA4]CAK6697843.1 hypothetical protein BBFGKLBO_02335 [Synechococcus sp. CBW1107]
MYNLIAAALEHERAHRWQDALENYRRAHAQDPSCETLVLAMARLQERIGHGDEALKLLEQELLNNPESVAAQLGLAGFRFRRKDHTGARAAYSAILDTDPSHLGARVALAALDAHCPTRRILLVLGMHRSGTSVVTRALCMHGCRAPATMPPADTNNPSGYWEPLEVVQLHTSLLEQAQSSWDDPFLSEDLLSPYHVQEARLRLDTVLDREFPDQATSDKWCVIKDPRQCRLQPVWNEFIRQHGILSVAVIVSRHPLAVVASLHRRDHIPANRALLLWIQHQLDAERHTRGMARLVVCYERFLEDPEGVLQGMGNLLNAGGFHPPEGTHGRDLVRPELDHSGRHPCHPGSETDEGLIRLALEVHGTLLTADDSDRQHRLDRCRDELERHLRILRSQLGRMTTLQLFWQLQDSDDFTEFCSSRCSISVDRGTTIHAIRFADLPGPIRALRFDPAETPCLVRLSRLSITGASGDLLWDWTALGADNPETLPFRPANLETRLISETLGMGSVSILCEGHDPALLLRLPTEALHGIDSGSRLTIEASWDLLSSELSQILASLPTSS